MDIKEVEKFNSIISESYNDILIKRPEKPLHHFIYHMLSGLNENLICKDATVAEFYRDYKNNHLKNVKEIEIQEFKKKDLPVIVQVNNYLQFKNLFINLL